MITRFYVKGMRPVKVIQGNDGVADCFVYNWTTMDFDRDLSYIEKILQDHDADVEEITEKAFMTYVRELHPLYGEKHDLMKEIEKIKANARVNGREIAPQEKRRIEQLESKIRDLNYAALQRALGG